jgi:hypothetical protein
MALVSANRVLETSTTSGTGALTLAGTVAGYQSFASGIGNANTCYYTIVDSTANVWETGIGTFTTSGNTLARTTVLSNSSGTTSALTLAGNSVNVFVTLPSEKSVYLDDNGNFPVINLLAGTTTVAPLDFAAGTNLTTPVAGACEYDGKVFYATPIARNRAVSVIEHFVARTGTKTMTSNTALQSIFDNTTGSGGLTSGALTVGAATSYFFEMSINVNTMSATSGNFGFSIVGAGTATFTSAAWHAFGLDSTNQATAAASGTTWQSTAGATGNIITAAVGTSASAIVKGIFRINSAGTIIPSIQLTTASAAVIGANTWFKCYPVGTNTVISVGNWA